MIEQVMALRYVTPMREGGSLPGLVEADDLGIYVVKFTGAGQGRRALVAEVITGELGRRLGIAIPELRAVQLDADIARYEADEEVQDLLRASVGLNLGVDFLPGAFGFDAGARPDPEAAARILWLDAYTANVDRSWRNPNLLSWHRRLWAIDHGATLYFHHSWPSGIGPASRFAKAAYDISDHVLGGHAELTGDLHTELATLVTREALEEVVLMVPDAWLEPVPDAPTHPALRDAYVSFLLARLESPDNWLPGGRR